MLSTSLLLSSSALRKGIGGSSITIPVIVSMTTRQFAKISNDNNNNKHEFRPRRRPDRNYRPIMAGAKKVYDPIPGNDQKFLDDETNPIINPIDDDDRTFGKLGGEFLRQVKHQRETAFHNQRGYFDSTEEDLRMMDYYLSQAGSIEDMVGERRALAKDCTSEQERAEYLSWLDRLADEDRRSNLRSMIPSSEPVEEELYDPYLRRRKEENEESGSKDDDRGADIDPNQLAFGDWSTLLVSVNRNVRLWRGGRLESYRALVIGGNLNGCGGFGLGKAEEPFEAVNIANRVCKRNVFFVDRYQGNGLTRDLVGKQNSCKLVIRANDSGLYGNELVREILKRFGITNASAKAYGNRTPYNVVYATFKALMTHESIEDIALKRGKRIISLDRARRLQI